MLRLGKIGIVFRRYCVFWTVCILLLLINIFVLVQVIGRQEDELQTIQTQYLQVRKRTVRAADSGRWADRSLQAEGIWHSFREKLPPMALVSGRIKEIDDIIQEHAVKSGELRFTQEWMKGMDLWRYSSELSAQGSYPEIKKLLARIQNSTSFFCIEKLSLAGMEGQGDVDLTLRLATYCR